MSGGEEGRREFVSYSANFEDVYLHRVFGRQASGFYVDVGAGHPSFENDTRALHDRGWRGVNIEPNDAFFEVLAAERPGDRNLRLAVSDRPGVLTYHEVAGTGLSTADAGEADRARARGHGVSVREVPADTLAHILAEAALPAIDLLKVDVEGYELKALASNDWSRFRPRLIVVEATFPETPVRRPDEVSPFLAGQGYRHVFFDGLNDYYAETGFDVPAEAFDRPVNVFDRFVTDRYAGLRRARAFLEGQVRSLEDERANARTYAASLEEALAALRQERDNALAYTASLEEAGAALRQANSDSQARNDALLASLGESRRERDRVAREARQCRFVLDSTRTDLGRAASEVVAMRRRAGAFSAQLDAVLLRAATLEHTLEHATGHAAAERARHEAQRQARESGSQLTEARLRAEVAALNEALRLHGDEAHRLRQTTSWRVTRPLRAVRRPVRTLRLLLGGGTRPGE